MKSVFHTEKGTHEHLSLYYSPDVMLAAYRPAADLQVSYTSKAYWNPPLLSCIPCPTGQAFSYRLFLENRLVVLKNRPS